MVSETDEMPPRVLDAWINDYLSDLAISDGQTEFRSPIKKYGNWEYVFSGTISRKMDGHHWVYSIRIYDGSTRSTTLDSSAIMVHSSSGSRIVDVQDQAYLFIGNPIPGVIVPAEPPRPAIVYESIW